MYLLQKLKSIMYKPLKEKIAASYVYYFGVLLKSCILCKIRYHAKGTD